MQKKKTKWTIENIREGFKRFYDEHGRYPTSIEIDNYAMLPSSRQIQRVYGGLPALRKQLEIGGPDDYTKGEYSSQRSAMIGNRAHKIENDVYNYLVGLFGKPFVHREYFFTDDRRTRTDFFIYYKDGNFSIDVFFPKDVRCLSGCLNSKLKNYGRGTKIQYPVIFLMMNDEISDGTLELIIARKKNKLSSNQKLMSFNQLKVFCVNKQRLK
jgi:hypothetical protein